MIPAFRRISALLEPGGCYEAACHLYRCPDIGVHFSLRGWPPTHLQQRASQPTLKASGSVRHQTTANRTIVRPATHATTGRTTQRRTYRGQRISESSLLTNAKASSRHQKKSENDVRRAGAARSSDRIRCTRHERNTSMTPARNCVRHSPNTTQPRSSCAKRYPVHTRRRNRPIKAPVCRKHRSNTCPMNALGRLSSATKPAGGHTNSCARTRE